MQPRRPSRSSVLPALFCAAALGLWGCGPPDGAEVTPEVVAGCEAATEALKHQQGLTVKSLQDLHAELH